MKKLVTILLMVLCFSGLKAQKSQVYDFEIPLVHGTLFSGLAVVDSVKQKLEFRIVEGNEEFAFCFGKPEYFGKKVDNTGLLYVNNPVIIKKKGKKYVWNLTFEITGLTTGKITFVPGKYTITPQKNEPGSGASE